MPASDEKRAESPVGIANTVLLLQQARLASEKLAQKSMQGGAFIYHRAYGNSQKCGSRQEWLRPINSRHKKYTILLARMAKFPCPLLSFCLAFSSLRQAPLTGV
jgi:hypothetical protein